MSINKENDDDQIEKLLSINELLIINSSKIEYNCNYHFSKGSPYGPYYCFLKDGNLLLYCFDYRNSNINITLQFVTKYEIKDIGLFNKIKKNDKFIYTYNIEKLNLNEDWIKPQINTLNNLNISAQKKDQHTKIDKQINQNKQIYKSITINEIVENINQNKTLFLTGAGISYNSVPDLKVITDQILNIDSKNIIVKSKNVVKLLTDWFNGMLNAFPSVGHEMIKNICEKTQSGLITGNFDMLHQKSGIIPFRIQGRFRKYYEDDRKENLQKIKLLIVIGCSIDILKQVAFFRESGATIIIFVYDKNNIPSFVGPNDYVIFGDLHNNLKEISEIIKHI